MNDLRNKNIIVTGATGGIGNSIIKKLNEYGANILATGTNVQKLDVPGPDEKFCLCTPHSTTETPLRLLVEM